MASIRGDVIVNQPRKGYTQQDEDMRIAPTADNNNQPVQLVLIRIEPNANFVLPRYLICSTQITQLLGKVFSRVLLLL